MTIGRRHAPAVPLRKQDLPGWVAWPIVIGLTVGSALLGFFDLTKRSLWLDEGYTWITADQRLGTIVSISKTQGYHLLGYYLVIHAAIVLFGDTSFVMRTPSVLAAAISVPFVYLLVARLGGRLAALYATVLFVFSQPLVFWQQNARDYTFVVLFAVLSTLAAVVWLQSGRIWPLLGWVVVTGIGCYTHPEVLLLLPPQLIVLLAWARSLRTRLTLIGICALGALAIAPVLLEATTSSVYQVTPTNPPAYGSATEIATFLASAAGSTAPVTPVDHALLGITFAIAAIGLGILAFDVVDRGLTAANFGLGLSLAWLILPLVEAWVVSETGHPDFIDRYLMLSLPAAPAVIGLVLIRLRPKYLGAFVAAYLAVFHIGVLIPSYHYPHEEYREATAWVLEAAQKGDCITFTGNAGRVLFDYYATADTANTAVAAGRPGRYYVPETVLPHIVGTDPKSVLLANEITVPELDFFQSPAAVAVAAEYCTRIFMYISHNGFAVGTPANEALYQSYVDLDKSLRTRYQPVEQKAFPAVTVVIFDRVHGAPTG